MGFIFERNFRSKARLIEEQYYEIVSSEIEAGLVKKGLWMKAYAQSNGNERLAESLYVKLRVQSLKDEVELLKERMEGDGGLKMNKSPMVELIPDKFDIGKVKSAVMHNDVGYISNIKGCSSHFSDHYDELLEMAYLFESHDVIEYLISNYSS